MCISAGSIEVYAEDEMYALRLLTESDQENYIRTLQANSSLPILYDFPEYAEQVWQSTQNEAEQIFCIIKKETGAYCGFCNLRFCDTTSPEIGISILPEYQGMEIGYRSLRLMLDTYAERSTVDFFVAMTAPENKRCIALMEKMGAGSCTRGDKVYDQLMEQMIRQLQEQGLEELAERARTADEELMRFYRLDIDG